MKNIFLTILMCLTIMVVNTYDAHTQTHTPKESIDTDIRALRNAAVPQFSSQFDDYIQYSPAGLMLALKVGGYEGRSSWGRMLTADAFSTVTMAAMVKGLKYTVRRMRPDGSDHESFPSGHSAKAFMTATMLHKEYGWRSPWFSIGGYTVAAATGVSRIMNDEHWMSDIVTGAAIGIGAVHLGYFISDLIFKEKGLLSGFQEPQFSYDPMQKHYVAELMFGRRFIFGSADMKATGIVPERGGLAGISTDIPVIAGAGVTARASASSLTYSTGSVSDLYNVLAGGYWNLPFAKLLEFQARAMAGCAWHEGRCGIDLSAGAGLSLIIDNNFKIKGFADYESVHAGSGRRWINSVVVGYSASWFW